MKYLLLLIGVVGLMIPTVSAQVRVLIVGTTKDSGQAYPSSFGSSKAYDISKVRDELKKILDGAGMGAATVTLHDFSTNAFSTAYGNQLLGEFYNPSTSYQPTSADFWKTLRGENGTDWDVVILMDEPHIIENYPGLFTWAAKEVGKEVAKGGGQTVLFMSWPGTGSASSVNHYKEVYYRTGRSLGYKVVPAGIAWETLNLTDNQNQHPSSNEAYLAAASIYSRVWGVEGQDKSAAQGSTYSFNGSADIANAVHQVVKDYKAKSSSQIYTGDFVHPRDTFKPIGDKRRETQSIAMNSSTEGGFLDALRMAGQNTGMDIPNGSVVQSGPRGLFTSRYSDQYNTGCAMSSPFVFASVGDDKSTVYADIPYLPSYLRTASSMLPTAPNYRYLPLAFLFAQTDREFPDLPFIYAQHSGPAHKLPPGSYWLTMMTGRCGMIPEPATKTIESESWRIGYEAAWALSKLQGRAPGFQVRPSDMHRHEVDPLAPETMSVRFLYPPKHNVTVTVSTDVSWATVSPATLTFTPQNYQTLQQVTVSVTQEAASQRGSIFNVSYNTSSTDEVYHALSDSWEYGVNTLPIADPKSANTLAGQNTKITLTSTDPDINSRIIRETQYFIPKQTMTYSIVEGSGPENGQVVLNGDVMSYTPNPGFAGTDTVQVRVFDGLAFSNEPATITFNVVANGQYDFNLLLNPGAEFATTQYWTGGGWTIAGGRTGNYRFTRGTLYQEVDISDYADAIAAGLQYFDFSGYAFFTSGDSSTMVLDFRDANGQIVGTPYESANPTVSGAWTQSQTRQLAPANAVVARVTLKAVDLNADGKANANFDDMSLKAVRPVNSAPVALVPPLASIAQNVPTVIPLAARDIDRLPADSLSYEIVSGPTKGQITGWQGGMPIYTPNANFLGEDSFTFRAYDGQVWSANTAVASILVRPNEAPSIVVHTPVMPESNTIYMPATAGIIFETTVTDDGGPINPGAVTIQWDQLQGPVQAVFDAPNSATTACTWGPDINPGTYVFRVRASDGQYATSKQFTVVVLNGGYDREENLGVQVDVGGPYPSVAAGQWLLLRGNSLSDDGKPLDPGYNTIKWSKISGRGNVTFERADRYETNVQFEYGGTFILRLTADDGQIKSYEDVTLTVTGPTVNMLTVIGGSAEGGSYHPTGAVVPIVANEPQNGDHFVNWTTSDGGTIADPTATNTTYTMPSGDATLTANFEPNAPPTANAGADRPVALVDERRSWTPADMSTTLWVDASDTSTITADGSNLVSEWRDKRGSGLNLTQATASRQPTTGATINSLNAIDFTGDVMTTATNPFGASVSNGFVMLVHNVDAIADGILFSLTGVTSPTGSRWQANAPWGSGVMNFDVNAASATANRLSAAYGVSAGTVAMSSFYSSTTDNVQQVYKNGILLAGDSTGASASTVSGLSIGGVGTTYQNTTIGELLVINGTVSADDRQKLEGYLAHKWGLVNNLPSDPLHPYKSAAPTTGGIRATLTLNGSVSDLNRTTPSATWSVVSTQPAGLSVQFTNSSSPVTEVEFTSLGTYTLRLTADDGIAAPVSDDVVITVTDGLAVGYDTWAGSSFAKPFTDTAMTSNPDGDRRSNLMEFAFGTDPTITDMGPLATDGSKRGDPVAAKENGGGFALYYIRRADHGSAGSVIYSTHFSDDLTTFTPSSAGLVVVGTAGDGYELVKVPFPSGARFGYVKVEAAP